MPLGKASLGKTRPSFCGKLACSQRGETFGAVIGLLRQNAKSGRPPSIHHHKPTSLLAMSGAAGRSPAERTSALRSLFAPRACRCSFSQSKRYAAATTACLLPRAISPPMLTALRFCLASADPYLFTVTLHHHHRLRQRSGRHANVVCRISSLSCMITAFAHSVWNWGEDTPPSHRCATSTTM